MSEVCPFCGCPMTERSFKVTAGYYGELQDYIVNAHSPNEAEEHVRKIVRKTVHPEADVVSVKEVCK